MKTYTTNTKVRWPRGYDDDAEGRIREVRRETFTRKIEDISVTRHGSEDNPAYLIEQTTGNIVIKLHSELEKAS